MQRGAVPHTEPRRSTTTAAPRCTLCHLAEGEERPAEVRCPTCGLELCSACAAAGPCPRCKMPWQASAEAIEAYRAHGEAVRATWPRLSDPARVSAFRRALDAGVPASALRRQIRRLDERIRHIRLEAEARDQEAGR